MGTIVRCADAACGTAGAPQVHSGSVEDRSSGAHLGVVREQLLELADRLAAILGHEGVGDALQLQLDLRLVVRRRGCSSAREAAAGEHHPRKSKAREEEQDTDGHSPVMAARASPASVAPTCLATPPIVPAARASTPLILPCVPPGAADSAPRESSPRLRCLLRLWRRTPGLATPTHARFGPWPRQQGVLSSLSCTFRRAGEQASEPPVSVSIETFNCGGAKS